MTTDLNAKAPIFRGLHEEDRTFLMPNAWNAGTARIFESLGFAAIGTTSAGMHYSNGRGDYDYRVSRDEMLSDCGRIAAAVDLPVSGDLENGYGASPEAVAETISRSIREGLVGGSIEDHTGDRDKPLYDLDLAVERIAAADAAGIPYTLTARAETYLVGHPDPFVEAVRRVTRYREAGADCLFVPGVKDKATIGALVRETAGPVSVVVGLTDASLSLAELADLGVRRISIGGSLARATFGLVRRAAQEMLQIGTFSYASGQIPDDELNAFMRHRP